MEEQKACRHTDGMEVNFHIGLNAKPDTVEFDINSSPLMYYSLHLGCKCRTCNAPMQFAGAITDALLEQLYPGHEFPAGTVYSFAPTVSQDGFTVVLPFAPPDMMAEQDGIWARRSRLKRGRVQ